MKHSIYPNLCTLLLLSVVAQAMPADSLSLQQKILEMRSPAHTFRSQIWKNPSLQHYLQDFSLTTLKVDTRYEQRGAASMVQQGTGYKEWDLNVSSFVKLSEQDNVFGSASYSSNRLEEVRWNENADYNILYPYLTGDSIGGYLKGETYRFSGGYARRWNAWTWGTKLSYRASLSYRDQDPRPRNVVSDLNFALSAVRTWGAKYLVGTSLHVRKYNQRSNITFLADKGATPVYQMLGLGMDYVRFAGTQTSSNYSGMGFGGSIDLLPVYASGVSISLAAHYFGCTKELTNLNNAPLNELKELKLSSELAWIHAATEGRKYGVKMNADISLRRGIENIFGDPIGNIYPIISSVSQYDHANAQVVFTGLIESTLVRKRTWGWSLKPTVEYGWLKSEYKSTVRSVEVAALRCGLQATSVWKTNHWLFTAEADGGYTSNLKSTHFLPGLDATRSVGQALLSNIRYLADSHTAIALSFRTDYTITAQRTLFLAARWQHQAYSVCGSTHCGELSLGFIF